MSSTAETIERVTTRSRSVPSKGWYWVAAAIVLLGVGFGVTWGLLTTMHTHDAAEALPRSNAPGQVEVKLGSGESRLIYFEGEGRPSPEALGLKVMAPDGTSVPILPYDLLMEYEIAGWVGAPVASFSAPADGTYVVSAHKPYQGGDIAVGDNFVRSQAISIVSALAIIGASLIAGLVIVVAAAVKRSKAGVSSRA